MGFGVTSLAVALAGVYARAVRPNTYHDAVSEALDQRHVAYTGLEVREICLPDPHCIIGDGTRTFAAVVVRGGVASSGQITCYDRRGDCYLDLAALGIHRASLRDLRGVRWMPKPVARIWERGAAWLRGRLRPTSSYRRVNSESTASTSWRRLLT
jgi:hypothetical protein